MDNNYIILIIDDLVTYCQATARWLNKACGCDVAYACDPIEAEKILRTYPIKVIIFDWNMPRMNGTDLNDKLREIDTRYKSILLSGEAPTEIMADPLRNFDYSIVKDKDDHLLPSLILKLMLEYDQSDLRVSGKSFHIEKVCGLFSKRKILYSISSIQILDNKFIPSTAWAVRDEVKDTIRAGEDKEIELNGKTSIAKSISENLKTTRSQGISAKLGLLDNSSTGFDASFSQEIEQTLSSTYTFIQEKTENKKWKRALPADGDIQYERFEMADVLIKIRVFISTSFSWSNQKYIDWFDLVLPTKQVAGRFYQCKKNGNVQKIDAGIYTIL
ncbi:MAG: response regulator [Eubacteriales bacterium]